MPLPNLKFTINSRGLGRLAAVVSKVPGLVLTGVPVAGKAALGKSYQITSLQDAEALGIEAEGSNAFAHGQIKDFYETAGQGSALWLMLVSDATTLAQMADPNAAFAKKLAEDAKGAIRIIGLCKKTSATAPAITAGLDADCHTAVEKAQALGDSLERNHMPVRFVLSGNNYSGQVADLKDYSEAAFNKAALFISNHTADEGASVGLLMGRLAAVPTQRSIARVKDGAAMQRQAYFSNGQSVESQQNSWNAIHDKGYIFLRSFQGKAGYYFSDDNTLTKADDDFSSLARGLVMDEVQLIAYGVLADELSEEVPVENGKIHPAIIKTWQSRIENQVQGLMVAQGKLSGFSAFIDPEQNVLQSDKILVSLQPTPVGYAKTIEINLGFSVN